MIHVDAWLQNCMVHCVFTDFGCVMTNACHAELEYSQDGGCRKNANYVGSPATIEMLCWLFIYVRGCIKPSVKNKFSVHVIIRTDANHTTIGVFINCILNPPNSKKICKFLSVSVISIFKAAPWWQESPFFEMIQVTFCYTNQFSLK